MNGISWDLPIHGSSTKKSRSFFDPFPPGFPGKSLTKLKVLKKELQSVDSAGRSPLLLAVQLGHQAVVERLWLGATCAREASLEKWGKDLGNM